MYPPILQTILDRGTVEAADGSVLPLHNHVKPLFLSGLYKAARATDPRLIIEVGMCYGVSSLVLAQALADSGAEGRLVCIDAYEDSHWNGIGRLNVERAELPVDLEVITDFSHLALPRLLEAGTQADFVFLDGNHSRDYARTDAFFAHRLLRDGGVLALDDAKHRPIARLCRDLLRDYHYEEVTPMPPFWRGRRIKRRLSAAIGIVRHPRVRCFRKLDDYEPKR